MPISGGVAIYAGPRSPMNKVIGLGFDTPLDPVALGEIEDRWQERDDRSASSSPRSPIRQWLVSPDRGYRLCGFENVLASTRPFRRRGPQPRHHHQAGPDDDLDDWFRIAIDAFASMDGTGSVADEALPREELERALADVLGAQV